MWFHTGSMHFSKIASETQACFLRETFDGKWRDGWISWSSIWLQIDDCFERLSNALANIYVHLNSAGKFIFLVMSKIEGILIYRPHTTRLFSIKVKARFRAKVREACILECEHQFLKGAHSKIQSLKVFVRAPRCWL